MYLNTSAEFPLPNERDMGEPKVSSPRPEHRPGCHVPACDADVQIGEPHICGIDGNIEKAVSHCDDALPWG